MYVSRSTRRVQAAKNYKSFLYTNNKTPLLASFVIFPILSNAYFNSNINYMDNIVVIDLVYICKCIVIINFIIVKYYYNSKCKFESQ